nr:GAF domain-containing protein [Sulfitobacter sp. W027]
MADRFSSTILNFDDALRELYFLAVEPNLRLEDKVAKLLTLGTEALGLELGIVNRVNDPVYECIFVHGPEWAPNPGTIFDVSGTYCLHTLHNDHVTAFHHAGQQEMSSHPCYQNFRMESYIGAPLKRGSEYFGALNFSSRVERDAPFSESQVEFVGFMSRGLGNELKLQTERRELREQRGLFSAVIDAVPDAIILVDPDRQIPWQIRQSQRFSDTSRLSFWVDKRQSFTKHLRDMSAQGQKDLIRKRPTSRANSRYLAADLTVRHSKALPRPPRLKLPEGNISDFWLSCGMSAKSAHSSALRTN